MSPWKRPREPWGRDYVRGAAGPLQGVALVDDVAGQPQGGCGSVRGRVGSRSAAVDEVTGRRVAAGAVDELEGWARAR